VRLTGRGDASDSTVGVHSLLAAVPDRHHLRRISAQQARAGQYCVLSKRISRAFVLHAVLCKITMNMKNE